MFRSSGIYGKTVRLVVENVAKSSSSSSSSSSSRSSSSSSHNEKKRVIAVIALGFRVGRLHC